MVNVADMVVCDCGALDVGASVAVVAPPDVKELLASGDRGRGEPLFVLSTVTLLVGCDGIGVRLLEVILRVDENEPSVASSTVAERDPGLALLEFGSVPGDVASVVADLVEDNCISCVATLLDDGDINEPDCNVALLEDLMVVDNGTFGKVVDNAVVTDCVSDDAV